MQDTPAPLLPTGLAGDPVIDLDELRTLASVLGPERMTRMAATFFVDAKRRMALLDRHDVTPADLYEHTHALVSMAGHLGLRQLAALCMKLQERARSNGGLDGRPALECAMGEAELAVQAAIADGVLHEHPSLDAMRPGSPGGASMGTADRSADGGGFAAAS